MKKFNIKINGNPYQVEIKDSADNLVKVEVNGSLYEVQLEREVKATKTPVLVRGGTKPVHTVEPLATTASTKKIISPLPGTIIRIAVKEGDQVKTGESLLILEAMKMENNILAESSGVVKSILVKPGTTVLQGDVLLEIS